jgi:hypothetical protein
MVFWGATALASARKLAFTTAPATTASISHQQHRLSVSALAFAVGVKLVRLLAVCTSQLGHIRACKLAKNSRPATAKNDAKHKISQNRASNYAHTTSAVQHAAACCLLHTRQFLCTVRPPDSGPPDPVQHKSTQSTLGESVRLFS